MLHFKKDVDISKITSNTLKEYFSFKEQTLDCITFFQIGTFYETFFEDAKILSDITGVTLSSRNFSGVGEVLQAGIPITSISSYIKLLLGKDYKICLCQENKNDETIKTRKLTRIFTKGTIVENELLDIDENNYILALYQDKNKINLAYADVSTGQFYKTSGNLEEIKLELEKIEPNELLILEKQNDIFKDISSKYNTTYLNNQTKKINAENLIINYCKCMQQDFCTKLDKLKEYNIKNYLTMDNVTRRNLELTRTRRYLKRKGSLLWFLNDTKTAMGARLLKKYLNEPLLNIDEILNRQNAVEELVKNKDILSELQKTMEKFSDLSRICSKISNSTILPKDLLQIAKNSDIIKNLYEICSKLNSNLLKLNKEELDETIEFANEVKTAIKKEPSNELKSGDIINSGYHANLDYLKNSLNSCLKEITAFETKEKNRLEINNLKILSSRILGYYIEIPTSKTQKVPNDYLRKQALANCSRYTTEKLQNIEQEIFKLQYQINELEYELYCQLRLQALKFVDTIRELAKQIARIDVLASFAGCAIVNNLSKPIFNNEKIYIKNGFHPSLLKLKNEITRNDTELSNGTMIVLTGANMSGKSTFLKYNAIILLLAQIGSFIPAQSANLTIVDKIFMRQGSTDDIINNNSSFMVEMNDLKYILDNITDSSIVFLDEPAKSTNAKEGGAISRAFCEYLLLNHNAKVIVTTHNEELTKIEKQYPSRAFNYVIGNSETSELVINDRKIRKGVINSSLAINTAKLANLPKELIELALVYAK
ncbi:MAG: DNA mismatch repair protein MutS [Candidatus Gastranaerophilales bacterium]|nr:DNA mismatch repair protein MutS [Candidatus Gastranaerophilales bacterium]